MRIHSDTLTRRDLWDAATIARVEFDRFDDKGSRSRDHAFDVTLEGESRRRPNNRGNHNGAFAATWDQWGVFLAVLFSRDPGMVAPYYADHDEFNERTNHRFAVAGFWPADAHGDHHFQFDGVPFEQECTKCTAIRRWGPR